MKNYNKSEIMKRAWNAYKAEKRSAKGVKVYNFSTGKFEPEKVAPFASFLASAWANAKAIVKEAARQKELASNPKLRLEDIESRIFLLKMKDRWSEKDFQLSHQLRAEHETLLKEIQAA